MIFVQYTFIRSHYKDNTVGEKVQQFRAFIKIHPRNVWCFSGKTPLRQKKRICMCIHRAILCIFEDADQPQNHTLLWLLTHKALHIYHPPNTQIPQIHYRIRPIEAIPTIVPRVLFYQYCLSLLILPAYRNNRRIQRTAHIDIHDSIFLISPLQNRRICTALNF